MHVFAKPFWTSKSGYSDTEYEDAFYPQTVMDAKASQARFAIADGATETSFSRVWAKLLVSAVGRGHLDPEHIEPTLTRLRSCWKKLVCKKDLPWYAEEKARLGAFSSILGLSLSEDQSGKRWRSFAVGDSCLFHMRQERLLLGFPIEKSSVFSSRPRLVSSVPEKDSAPLPSFLTMSGEWEFGDNFFMMSDALACWFLQSYEFGNTPWELLRNMGCLGTPDAFQSLVADLRKEMLIKNDDVTLITVSITR